MGCKSNNQLVSCVYINCAWYINFMCFSEHGACCSNVLFDSCCESNRRVPDSFESIKRGRSTCDFGGETSRLFFRRNTKLFENMKLKKVHKSS